jgi:branched-chain amino acid transport system ATP-binding protein
MDGLDPEEREIMNDVLLQAQGVKKDFGGLRAIRDLSFQIHRGEIFSIIGPNGSGKTTTFNLVTGFLPVTEGEIFFKGEKISGLKPYEICRKGMARTFQITTLFERNTVLENLLIGQRATREAKVLASIFGIPGARQRENEALARAHVLAEFTGLAKHKMMPAGALPQGAQKQLSIGLALASAPELLLLDEPVGGVNMEEIGALIDLISRIRKSGITICLIEHKMSVVMNISDRIIVLSYGEKIAEGSPTEVSGNEKVIQSYLGEKYAAARRSD